MEYDKNFQNRINNNILETIVNYFNKVLIAIAGVCITLMMLLIVGNAIIRVISRPFSGTVEVVGWLAAIAVSFALGYTQLEKGHVSIDLLVSMFNPSVRKIVQSLVYVVSTIFFIILGWQMFLYGNNLAESGAVSSTIQIAYYPFVYLVAIGFIGIILALLSNLIILLKQGGE